MANETAQNPDGEHPARRLCRLRFQLAVTRLYEAIIRDTNDARDEQLNAGIATVPRYIRKVAEDVLERFQSVEEEFKLNYFAPYRDLPVTGNDEAWLRAEAETIVSDQLHRAEAMIEKLSSVFVGSNSQHFAKYVQAVRAEAELMRNRIETSIAILVLEKGQVTTFPQDNARMDNADEFKWDVFVCHASEDEDYVRDLVKALYDAKVRVWPAWAAIEWGDDLRGRIDDGLKNSRYAIVVFSKAFLAKKKWTEYELSSLFAIEEPGKTRILPIWHGVSDAEMKVYSPGFSGRLAKVSARDNLDDIVRDLKRRPGLSARPWPPAIADPIQPLSPDFIYILEELETVFGRDQEIERGRDFWLEKRRLLIWGAPGIGKSTLARSILRDDTVKEQFGARRYEVRCEDLTKAEDLIGRMSRDWFGLKDTSPKGLEQSIIPRLVEKPCAILVDNFETLMRSRDASEREHSRHWLARLAALPNVWTMVAVQGHERPADLLWGEAISPASLSIEFAQKLFCAWSQDQRHERDPHLERLLRDVDCVPHAVKLLGGAANGKADLADLEKVWKQKAIETPERTEKSYEFAIGCLKTDALQALKILAWLPAGAAVADLESVLQDILADAKLHRAALAYQEGSPPRLKMLKPLRDHVAGRYPVSNVEKEVAIKHFLELASEGNELGGRRDGEIVGRLTDEFPNLLTVIYAALGCRNERSIEAALGVGRFSARTGIGHGEFVTILHSARDLAQQLEDKRGEAWCICCLGEIALVRSEYEAAEKYYNDARPLSHDAGDKRGEAACLRGLGEVAMALDKPLVAGTSYSDALPLSRDAGDKPGEAACLLGLGGVARRQNKRDEAEKLYNGALAGFNEIHDKRGEAGCLWCLGEIARERSDFDRAENHYRAALTRFLDVRDKSGEMQCRWCLGDIALGRSELDQAEKRYREALRLSRGPLDKCGEAACFRGLGGIARKQTKLDEAESYYREAKTRFRDGRDKRGEAGCLFCLGDIAFRRAELDVAEKLYNNSLALLGDAASGRAQSVEGLGDIARARHRNDQAHACWTQALRLFLSEGDEESVERVKKKLDEPGC